MVKILSPCVQVEEQRKIFFSLFFLFQTFFSSHFLLVLFLFSESAALVLALIPPTPPFVGLYWAQWSGFLSLLRLMSVCVCVRAWEFTKKRVGENEGTRERERVWVSVYESVWFFFGFPETAHYFCEGFLSSKSLYPQSACVCLARSPFWNIRNHRAVVDMTAISFPQ